jgi:anti-sigma factor RsiW
MTDPDDLPCQEFVELVTEYLEGTLSPEQRARFMAHLDDCDYCGDYLEQMRLTIRALGQLSNTAMATETRVRLLTEFREWKRTAESAPAR